jgi:dTDP-4-dehydrorhamnose 3,5-epimerase
MATVTESDVISGVFVVDPAVHGDDRGYFVETYRREWFPLGAIVGLHYHLHQADYWYVPEGRARVVLHDLREGSPTNGNTLVLDLGREPDGSHPHRGVFIPPGVAHGFGALTNMTITYLVDGYYNPADELGVAWNDPAVDADWGITDPILSERDQKNPVRADIGEQWRPHFSLRK